MFNFLNEVYCEDYRWIRVKGHIFLKFTTICNCFSKNSFDFRHVLEFHNFDLTSIIIYWPEILGCNGLSRFFLIYLSIDLLKLITVKWNLWGKKVLQNSSEIPQKSWIKALRFDNKFFSSRCELCFTVIKVKAFSWSEDRELNFVDNDCFQLGWSTLVKTSSSKSKLFVPHFL